MSLQELHIKALEDQVANLTRDCHYLLSLLNTTDNIDWENWEQGKQIREDLERSKDFFEAAERKKKESRRREDLARREREKKAREQYSKFNLVKDPNQKTIYYNDAFASLNESLSDVFRFLGV